MDLPSTSTNNNSYSLYRTKSTKIFDVGRRLEERLPQGDSKYGRNKQIPKRSLAKPVKNQTTITHEGSYGRFMEDKMLPEEVCLTASEAKLMAYKEFMKALHVTRSINTTKDHCVDLSSRLTNNLNNKNVIRNGPFDVNKIVKNETRRAEKTTYCRPVVNIYSHEFIKKTLEKNKILESTVNKLLQERQKEQQNEAWNNYINELKLKHGYYECLPKKSPVLFASKNENSDIFDDRYNIKYARKECCQCEHFLNHAYDDTNETSPERSSSIYEQCRHNSSIDKHLRYTNDNYCFPTSPEGKLLMLNRDKNWKGHWHCHPMERRFDYNKIYVEKERKPLQRKYSFKNVMDYVQRNIKNTSMQTDIKIHKYCKKCFKKSDEDIEDKYDNDSFDDEYGKQNVVCKCNVAPTSLSKIENKLEILLQSVKKLMHTIKIKNCDGVFSKDKNNVNICKSNGTCGSRLKEQFTCGVAHEQHSSSAFSGTLPSVRHETIDTIMHEEMYKSNKVKRDIEEILCNKDGQCAVQITIDIPTKDNYTEVTNSLHKEIVSELSSGDSRRMTIAVNTDPLGLFALLRMSTETLKQILSYVPNLDCSYLTRLPICNNQVVGANVSCYFCNICGASFAKPSQLSDHVQNHNLTNQRNCRICRQMVDMKHHPSVLFPCRHCSQVFTRSYCRELHELDCRPTHKKPDNASSLMLLS